MPIDIDQWCICKCFTVFCLKQFQIENTFQWIDKMTVPCFKHQRPNKKCFVFPVTCFLKSGLVGRLFISFYFCNTWSRGDSDTYYKIKTICTHIMSFIISLKVKYVICSLNFIHLNVIAHKIAHTEYIKTQKKIMYYSDTAMSPINKPSKIYFNTTPGHISPHHIWSSFYLPWLDSNPRPFAPNVNTIMSPIQYLGLSHLASQVIFKSRTKSQLT